MTHDPGTALVPVVPAAPAERAKRVPARRAAGSLMRLARAPLARRAAMAGVAFVAGYRLSKLLDKAGVVDLADSAHQLYRAAVERDPEAEGRLSGAWVRETLTVVYGLIDRDR